MLKTPQKRTEAEMFSVGDRIEVVREGQLVDLATVRPATERMTPKAGLVDSLRRSTGSILGRIALVRKQRIIDERSETPTIIAIVPAHNEEKDIDHTIESLLTQSRKVDRIVVMVNNSTDRTAEIARRYAQLFPEIIVDEVDGMKDGKVGALNYAWRKYANRGQFTFILGVDADVECDPEMVHYLEEDLLHQTKAAGVMARYGFKIPEGAKRREKRLISAQRAEFGMVGVKQQLRGGRSDILGGQATLFRSEALMAAARETDGSAPWNPISSVEDAELTRTFQRQGYRTAVSKDARAWVGPMITPYAWHKQRNKWQQGHLTDMLRDFHPVHDRRRWLDQMDMCWNLLIRMMFFALLVTSVMLDKFEFSPIWTIPVCMSVLQSLLVACKIPNRRAGEIIRALLFLPGEVYLWKSLAVWLGSVLKVALDIRRNLWEKQYSAEAANKTHSVSAWMTIVLATALPILTLHVVANIVSNDTMSTVMNVGWTALSAMTVFSVLWMGVWIVRILRQYSRLAP